ncbi:TonB-dependent receptor [Marinifilum sp. D737]|uniref:TonB-dependent receptor n=1 Tax=Marinifilum sp. D737 TaxID=2969628 RepID=UPI0022736161|nr:TonB-dependent receptor [Marinifilum sp. D737]MCY1634468.1 TonB-dependent receptor [Marinifilum sp. D737]
MRILTHLLVGMCMLIGFSFSANAEKLTASIKGKVIDVNSKEPIPYATVALEGSSVGAVTNFEGEFVIEDVPMGHYHVVASCVGYQIKTKECDLKAGKGISLEFSIAEDFIGLEQVVVTADRNNIKRKDAPVVVNSISTKLLEQTSAATLADGLVFSPGLRVENDCNNCGFSQVRMNGLEGPYTQILINSRPIFSGLAAVYGLEHIPSNMIQRVEVVRGGGSALFGGNAIAGTINIITKDPVSNSFKAGFKYGAVGVATDGAGSVGNDFTADFNASVVSEDNKSGIFIFGMNRQRDDWDANDDGYSDLVKIENLSAGLRAYHRFSDLSKLTLEYHIVDEFRRGGDQLNIPAHQALVAEQVKHRINSGGVVWDQFFNQDRHTKLSVYASAQHIDRDSYYGAASLEDDNGNPLDVPIPDFSSYGKTDDLAVSLGAQLHTKVDNLLLSPADLTFGVENVYNKLKDDKLGYYDIETLKFVPTTNIADQKSNTIGAFAQSKWDLGFMNFLLGVRMDSYNITNDENGSDDSNVVISPRANVLFKLSEPTQLRFSYARGFRAPQIFNEDLHIEASGARRIIHENDPNLKEETSNSFTASLDFTKTIGKTQTYFLVEGFYTDLKDPFVNEFSDPDADGNVVSLRKNAEGAVVKGANIEFKLAPSYKLDFQMGMTLQSSKYDEVIDHGDDDDASNSSSKNILRTPERYGYFAMNWKPIHEFTATFSGSYTGSMDVLHLAGGLDPNEKEITTESIVKSDDFMDMGINFAYHFDLGREVKLQFDFGVKNIFNSFQNDFDRGPSRDAGYVYGPLNPRTIYLGVKIGNF